METFTEADLSATPAPEAVISAFADDDSGILFEEAVEIKRDPSGVWSTIVSWFSDGWSVEKLRFSNPQLLEVLVDDNVIQTVRQHYKDFIWKVTIVTFDLLDCNHRYLL